MQILNRIGIDWRERRLISKLFMEQKVKVRLDRGETRSVQIGRERDFSAEREVDKTKGA